MYKLNVADENFYLRVDNILKSDISVWKNVLMHYKTTMKRFRKSVTPHLPSKKLSCFYGSLNLVER